MTDPQAPLFEELVPGIEYEFTLEDGAVLVATFDGYAPAFGTHPPDMPGAKDFARVRESGGQQHSLPREQIVSIKIRP